MPAETQATEGLTALIPGLPFPLALTLEEYRQTPDTQPFIKVHRLCDAAEMTTRFLTFVALSQALAVHGQFPPKVRAVLADSLERPTFGQWRIMLDVAVKAVSPKEAMVSGLRSYVETLFLPALGSNTGDEYTKIIALRNKLAHAGRLTDAAARGYLDTHQASFFEWAAGLAFLSHWTLLTRSANDPALVIALQGMPNARNEFPFWTPDSGTTPPDLEPGHVYLAPTATAGKPLNLYPFQAFLETLQQGRSQTVPQVYFRFDRNHVEYLTLSEWALYTQQGPAEPTHQRFLDLFPLSAWRQEKQARDAQKEPFQEDLIGQLADGFVGRHRQVEDIKKKLKGRRQGVLWLRGVPGVGKSALMAHMAQNLSHGSDRLLVPYFFRSGSTGCSVEDFLRRVQRVLSIPQDQWPASGAEPSQRRQQFREGLRQAADRSDKPLLLWVDGVDEVHRLDRTFLDLVSAGRNLPNVVWMLAGRPEFGLPDAMAAMEADDIYPEGLPTLDADGVRAMLTGSIELARWKYQLFALDTQQG